MSKEITCPPCGEVIQADNDDELVTKAQMHAMDRHDTELDREEILASVREA